MRLEELKIALVEQFFKASDNGIPVDQLFEVFVSLGKQLNVDLAALADKDAVSLYEEVDRGTSSDPSKAFRRFTDGRNSLLAIIEESNMAIFAAARSGKNIFLIDLTNENRIEKKCDLAAIKTALRQAKNINDDAYFSIITGE